MLTVAKVSGEALSEAQLRVQCVVPQESACIKVKEPLPVQASPAGLQVCVLAMIAGVPQGGSPSLKLEVAGEQIMLRLPIHLMNVMSPVDQMTPEAFINNWG